MTESVDRVLQVLAELPPAMTYLFIGVGAAFENLVPAVPADTFVLFGAFLAATGRASVWGVFVATWTCNVASALLVFWLARNYGARFFRTRIGNSLLRPRQIQQIADFYARWGVPAMFLCRFLPGVRAVVPVFAGIARVRARNVAWPIAAASALWYGTIVYLGAAAGRKWRAILAVVNELSDILWIVALAVVAGVAIWWWKTRHLH